MPKAKKRTAKAKKRSARTVTCGKCNEQGHNARTCPTRVTTTESPKAAPTMEIKSSKDIPPPPVTGNKTKIDARFEQTERRMSTVPKRDAPTADIGSAASAAPYRCVKCNSVAILVVVKVKDVEASFRKQKDVYKGEMRCEKCMNKPTPSDLILKWGASPGEIVPVPGQDD